MARTVKQMRQLNKGTHVSQPSRSIPTRFITPAELSALRARTHRPKPRRLPLSARPKPKKPRPFRRVTKVGAPRSRLAVMRGTRA